MAETLMFIVCRLLCLRSAADIDADLEFIAGFTHKLFNALSQTLGQKFTLVHHLTHRHVKGMPLGLCGRGDSSCAEKNCVSIHQLAQLADSCPDVVR